MPINPSTSSGFPFSSPGHWPGSPLWVVSTARKRQSGSWAGSCGFLYDPELLTHEQVDEKVLPGLRGVVKISHTVINGISLINLDGFAPASQWEGLSAAPVSSASRSNTEEATR
jgi:hypothetical protein